MKICVGARQSTLSQRQIDEVQEALRAVNLKVDFERLLTKAHGDQSLNVSLRKLDKTDFFTREIDQLLIEKKCRIAIHSAKDLPGSLPQEICLIAITAGLTPADVLVLPKGQRLEELPLNAQIGSSSDRRDRWVQRLRPDLRCKEVRGTVEKRLEKIKSQEISGLVVAEAALLRLGLSELNYIALPGKTAPLQGQLAVLARRGDREMERLFAVIDTRDQELRRVWHTGLECVKVDEQTVHCPLIAIRPRGKEALTIKSAFSDLTAYTHIIFTSKSGADLFAKHLNDFGFLPSDLLGKEIIAIGPSTGRALEKRGLRVTRIANVATQEGVIDLLRLNHLSSAYILLPQSARARYGLSRFLQLRGVRHQVCYLYDTVTALPDNLPDLKHIDEIIFTSPSTVRAYLEVVGALPKTKKLTPIGPITEAYLKANYF